jgi:hypothetical protein
MLYIVPQKKSRSRVFGKGRTDAPTPTALTLAAATYVTAAYVELTFDRAIDVEAMDVGAISVTDGDETMLRYAGSDVPVLIEPTRVRVLLSGEAADESPGVHLTVGAGNGNRRGGRSRGVDGRDGVGVAVRLKRRGHR